ncbi:MAG: acylphosphatase [Nitrosopumilaceae archaeon]|nr:acylphosphatase [Nitrosopumilaceae archaeon]
MNYLPGYRITIRGIVQNVGLRAQIKIVAERLGVCGTVENLRDGSVLIVCEAERADVEEMMRQILSGAEFAVIADVLVEEGPPATGMGGFEVIVGDHAEELLSAWSSRAKAALAMLAALQDKVGPSRAGEGPGRDKRDPGQDGTGPGWRRARKI